MIRCIWIDIDNTLLDFDAYVKEALREGFAHFDLGEYNEEVYRVFRPINASFWHRLETGEITYEELLRDRWNTVFEALGISFDGPTFERYFKARLFDSAIPVSGAMTLLEHLHCRYLLCVASNGPYEQQMNRLRLAGMTSYFSHFFISEAVGASKPSREFFLHGLSVINEGRQTPISPDEILMIGDSLSSDMAGAKNVGMHTCLLDRSGAGNAKESFVDYTVHSLEEILKLF